MPTSHVYLNGSIVPAEEAAISPFDIGLLRGYAVFDLLRTVGGRPFLLAEHLQRFRASAEELGLQVPVDDAELERVIGELLELNGFAESTVRLVLTGGVSEDGMAFDPATPTLAILVHELHEPSAEVYERGTALLTHEHRRELPRAKTTNYLTMLRHKERCAEEGALDLLYHADGRIAEAASASFYLVFGSTIVVPDAEVLWGTVGSLLLELAGDDFTIETRKVSVDEAYGADEAFLTSTTRGVVPVTRLDDRAIGDGTPGGVTRELISRWRAVVAG